MANPQTYTIYFGGELFSAKHLLGNAALAEAIHARSGGKYISILPQNLEQREVTPKAIRDQDLRSLLDCDLGLFNYDGPELDSGTVVEYVVAKCADLPSVILRTDFRMAGDQKDGSGDAWNLMSSFFPRTRVVSINGMDLYKRAVAQAETLPVANVLEGGRSLKGAQLMIDEIADSVIAAFDAVLTCPPVLPKSLTPSVYEWLALMPGLSGGDAENISETAKLRERKQSKGLL